MVDSVTRQRISSILLNVIVALGGVVVALPLVWMISASFKPLDEIYAYPPNLIPEMFTTRNYDRLFTDWPFWNWYGNSLAVAIIATIAVLFFTSLAGYAFAKYRFRGSRVLFIILLASTMIPFQLILVPLYIVMSKLSWTNSYFSLIIPFMAPALGIFLMRQFMVSIP